VIAAPVHLIDRNARCVRHRHPVALLALLLVGACSGNHAIQDAASSESLMAGEVRLAPSQVNEAIRQARREFDAAQTEIASCMEARGFDYRRDTLSIDLLGSSGTLRTDLEVAEEVGYGIVDNEGDIGVRIAVDSPTRSASEQATIIGSCPADSEVDPQARLVELRRASRSSIEEAWLVGQEMVAADAAWVECMSDLGYRYSSSQDAFSQLDTRYQELVSAHAKADEVAKFRDLEIRVATSDVKCNILHIAPVVNEIVAAHQADDPSLGS
jgi:hypothetical protein